MQTIFFTLFLLGSISLLAGVILSVVNLFLKDKQNNLSEQILEILPGANCGACGFSSCEEYAKALANKKSRIGLCLPGGEKVSLKLTKLLKQKEIDYKKRFAHVKCRGSLESTSKIAEFINIKTCAAANMLYAGGGKCSYGCLGFGDCINACEYGAISLKNGVSYIDRVKCVGCGKCIEVCPKNIIVLLDHQNQAIVCCSNEDKGAVSKLACSVSCVACRMCEKTCHLGAIYIKNNLASVDKENCIACGKCREVCPRGCIENLKFK